MSRSGRRLGSLACLASVVAAGALVRRRRHVNQRNFAGKVVFITGGSRGLGLALADQFLRAGAHVAIAARDPAELAKAKRHLLLLMPQATGRTVLEVVCDVTDPRSVEVAVETVQHDLGPSMYWSITPELWRLPRCSINRRGILKRPWIRTMAPCTPPSRSCPACYSDGQVRLSTLHRSAAWSRSHTCCHIRRANLL
jgi:short subunit dehydrogenase